jgi:hypothetical protein
MVIKLEIDIEDKACELALRLGVTNVKMKAAGVVGYPDRMFFIPGGRPLFIEFKRPGKEPDAVQKVIIRRLKYYGYRVEVCDTVQGAVECIKKALLDASQLPKTRRKIRTRT